MNANPWLTEQVVKGQMDDVRRRAARAELLAAARPRTAWSQQVGQVLIRAGRRLAGPEPATTVRVAPDPQGLGAGC